MGRPSKYTKSLADKICERMWHGESLRRICNDESMPDRGTVLRWVEAHDEFRNQYARAREALMDYYADEVVDIADDGQNDYMEVVVGRGKNARIETRLDKEAVMRSNLRVETRLKLMAKCAPKKYGAKVEIGGPDGGPVTPVIHVTIKKK